MPDRPTALITELEVRRLLSGSGLCINEPWELHTDLPVLEAAAATTTLSTPTAKPAAVFPLTAIPALSSRPGAPAKLYLDFNGDSTAAWGSYRPGTTPAYDIDGNATTFSDAEIARVREIWARVSEKYSPFNVNVTTVDPGALADRVAIKIVIGGTGPWLGAKAGGITYTGSFTNGAPNVGFVFSGNLAGGAAQGTAEATAHEAGHAFGLSHQAKWSGSTLVEAYSTGTAVIAPIMGNSYSAQRGVWWAGPVGSSSTSYQDDLAILSGATNGFGYRADDYGNAPAAASALALSGTTVTPRSGVIERTGDTDVFRFTTGAGAVRFTAAVAAAGPMLDARLTLTTAAGAVLATANTAALGETLSATVPAGTYYIAVAGKGAYGDLGTYTLSGTVVAPTITTPPPPATGVPTAPANLTGYKLTATSVRLQWTDRATNETGVKVYRSANNGLTWSLFGTTGVNSTGVTVSGLLTGTTYLFKVRATNAAGDSPDSNVFSIKV
ncbi:MAG TPA: fibronectin type III domain-containing protein [Tepidisphaeraceae bacterium]|nr:fibronectin type III domain-containing protein [Tepidisphaeraceae bacterium]